MANKPRYKKETVIAALHESKGMCFLAAKALKCNVRTVYNYRDRHEEVREVIEHYRGELVDTAESSLRQAVKNGEGWAISLALRSLGRERGYVEHKPVDPDGYLSIDQVVQIHMAQVALFRNILANRMQDNAIVDEVIHEYQLAAASYQANGNGTSLAQN